MDPLDWVTDQKCAKRGQDSTRAVLLRLELMNVHIGTLYGPDFKYWEALGL